MNPEPPHFLDDDEPLQQTPKIPKAKRSTSRAEVLGWFAAVFLFAGVAWLLLSSVGFETRAILSAGCLLIGGAFFAFAWRELR